MTTTEQMAVDTTLAAHDTGPKNQHASLVASLQRRLETNPKDVGLLDDLAVTLAQERRWDDALATFQRSLAVDPARTQIVHGTGYDGEAKPSDQQAVRPVTTAVHCLHLGRLCAQRGCLEEAQELLVRATASDGPSAVAYRDLGNTRRKLGQYKAAVEALSKALALDPNCAELHFDLAVAASDVKDFPLAKQEYQRAIALKPDYPDAFNNLGVLCQENDAVDEAVGFLQEAVRLRPTNAGGHNNLGVALAEQRKFDQAIQHYHKALAISPDYALAWNNLGNALRAIGKEVQAILALERAIALKPDYAEAANNKGIVHAHCGEHTLAKACYDRAIMLRPDYPEAHMNRGLELLAQADFERGWTDYEWRWHTKALRGRKGPAPRWDGSPLVGKRILVYFEQGLGDTFQFIRYVADLKARGATVVFEGQPVTAQILSRTPGLDEFVTRGQKYQACDFSCPLLSLPGLLKTRFHSIPCHVPYIHPDPELTGTWKPRLDAVGGFKVGIAWQGNPQHRGDSRRSAQLRWFSSLAAIPGVHLISLQRGFGSEQVEGLKGQFEITTFEGVDEETDGFARTAAIMKNLDLIICVDTCVAHLAGAMGLPVWLALPTANDWRWLEDREDSPWYPTVRIFRQQASGDWDELFGRIAEALRQQTSRAGSHNTVPGKEEQLRARHLIQDAGQLVARNQLSAAQEKLEQALRLAPRDTAAHHDIGVVHAKLGRTEVAIACFRRAIEIHPDSALAYANLGLAFFHAGKIEEAVNHLHQAVHLGGGTPDVHNNLGVALANIPDLPAASSAYLAALHLRPDYAEAHYNLSRALLAQGLLEQGWLEYEWRWKCLPEKLPQYKQSRWTGNRLPGKTILLYTEQGLGDAIQFVRYVELVKQRVGRVVVQCPASLVTLFARHKAIDEVVPKGYRIPHFDVHAPLMSLPAILGTTLETIPAAVPYLAVDPERVQQGCELLKDVPDVKVGIAWQGNPGHGADREHSIPLHHFAPLARVEQVSLISLQRKFGTDQITNLGGLFQIADLDPTGRGPDDLPAIAGVIQNLDLVITADTAVAHLAGALGVPVWLALPLTAEWRWLTEREDTPWYPTMRLFRQRCRGDWAEVFVRMAEELRSRTTALAARGNAAGQRVTAKGPLDEGRRRYEQGDLASAAAWFERALQEIPDSAAAHHDLGVVYAQQGRFDEAIEHFRQALRLEPAMTVAYGNLVLALLEKHDFAAAAAEAQHSLTVAPHSAELQYRAGMALLSLGKFAEAERHLRTALELRPDYAGAYIGMGEVQRHQNQLGEAVQNYRKAIELRPDSADTHFQLGTVYEAQGNFAAAVECHRNATRQRPDFVDAFKHLGSVLPQWNRLDEAIDALQQAVYLRPDDTEAHTSLATTLLAAGRFEQGWVEWEWRHKAGGSQRRERSGPRWDGSRLEGKRLLVTAEGDTDDMIQFLRYAKLAKERGATVLWECPLQLGGLLSTCPHVGKLIPQGELFEEFDFHTPFMSFPLLFGTDVEHIPANVPYLFPLASLVEQWKTIGAGGNGVRVGIAWDAEASSAKTPKSGVFQLDAFEPLAAVQGVELISLQAVEVAERTPAIKFPVRYPERLAQAVDRLPEVAALLTQLDLVVCVDSDIAHLAGALGIPVFLVLNSAAHWRWMRDRTDSPWYPTIRIFRQQPGADRKDIFSQVADALRHFDGKADSKAWNAK